MQKVEDGKVWYSLYACTIRFTRPWLPFADAWVGFPQMAVFLHACPATQQARLTAEITTSNGTTTSTLASWLFACNANASAIHTSTSPLPAATSPRVPRSRAGSTMHVCTPFPSFAPLPDALVRRWFSRLSIPRDAPRAKVRRGGAWRRLVEFPSSCEVHHHHVGRCLPRGLPRGDSREREGLRERLTERVCVTGKERACTGTRGIERARLNGRVLVRVREMEQERAIVCLRVCVCVRKRDERECVRDTRGEGV